MPTRLTFAAICVFFVTMNVWLWRTEFAGKDGGSALPAGVVWEKILSAQDDSRLEVFHKGKKLGRFRWSANIGEGPRRVAPGKRQIPDDLPEGQVTEITGYHLEVAEGSLFMDDKARRVTFRIDAQFSPGHLWREVNLTLIHKPTFAEIRATSTNELLHFKVHAGNPNQALEHQFTFAELREPEKLLARLGDSFQARLLLATLGGGLPFSPAKNFTLGLNWEARNDTVTLGSSRLRIYRLTARILDKYQIVVLVSRVGEILRVELPDDLRFINQEFGFNLQP